jgi:diaminohydroxyphosphoribosylaminopyrimidine deaminase/5-amino-6-(5-phosphoribosylamino)uracil reductase
LGSLLDARRIDEVHVLVAPKLIGGAAAHTPVAGAGVDQISQAIPLDSPEIQRLGDDVHIHGRLVMNGE